MSRLIAIARKLHAAGWPGLAVLLVRCALLARPGHPEALRLRCGWAIESGRYAEAERLCREMLRTGPERPGPLWDLAQLLLLRGAVEEAVVHFGRHAELTGGAGLVTRAFERRLLDPELAYSRRPYFKRLTDVLVDTGYWTIMEGSVIYSDDTHGRSLPGNPMVRGRVAPDGKTVVATFAAPRACVDVECVFVGGDDNYSHWLFRNLLKLSTLERAGLLDAYPWLLNSDLKRHQREYLELMGIDAARLVLVERHQVVRCSRLVVPAVLANKDTIPGGVDWIRGRLRHCMSAPQGAGRLIYVSRRDTARRTLVNEAELLAELAPLGFETVVPGELPVAEQIRIFSEARLIVGPTGAAFTNILFAPPSARLVVITSTALEGGDIFRRIAASMGLPITTVVSDRYPDGANPQDLNADFYADTGAVLRAARQLLR